MKSTIFTRKWLKEKGNDAYTYVSINVYTYTSMNEHYFITKHFPPSLLAQKVILAKKMGTTATAKGVSCYVQCNIPT